MNGVAVLTISLENELALHFRKRAAALYGKRKGYLARAVAEAFSQWLARQQKGEEAEVRAWLERGFDMGAVSYRTRSELHERSSI